MNRQQAGTLAKKISDFYFEIYIAKFKDKPIRNYSRDIKVLREFFEYNDFSLDFFKACVIVYIDLDDVWLQEQGYPMWSFPDRVYICKKELDYEYKFFKGEKEDFYKQYVQKNIDKYGEQNRPKNKKPSTNNQD